MKMTIVALDLSAVIILATRSGTGFLGAVVCRTVVIQLLFVIGNHYTSPGFSRCLRPGQDFLARVW